MFFGAKKDKGKSGKSKVFGVVLDASSKEIPQILESCVVYLDAVGLELEGIFRKSGSLVSMNQYKARFDNGEAVDFSDVNDPHIVAGLLKMFIRDYPEPLLTFELYDCFLAAVAIPDVNTKIPKVKSVLAMLPEANLRIVRYLVSFLCRVTAKSSVNLMTPQNLAIVFAPNLLRPPYEGQEGIGIMMEDTPFANELLQLFINHYNSLFLDTVKPVAAAQKAQPTPPVKPITTPTRSPIVSSQPISSRITTPSRLPNSLPTPPTPEQTSTGSEENSGLYPTDMDPFSSPEPPPKPPSRFANGQEALSPRASQALPSIPENKTLSAPAPPSSRAKSEFFSPPNPPPKPSRFSASPIPANESNPFTEDSTQTQVTSPQLTVSGSIEDTSANTNPFATNVAPPKPPRSLHASKSASSLPVEPTNPFSPPTAPPKPSSVNLTPQIPVKPPRNSTNISSPTDIQSAPPRPPRAELTGSLGVKPAASQPPPKPPRSPSLNSVGSEESSSARPSPPPVDLNPFNTPAPPPKPSRPNASHKHNKSLPNASVLVPAVQSAIDANRRPPSAPMPAIYPKPSQNSSLPPSQLYPVLTE